MDKNLLRMVQLTQLEIAKEVKRICTENNIHYFLDGGTLLGAVRHEGFIPWDDDLDIGMLREDYEKFLNIAPVVMDKKYFLQTPYSDDNYGLFFSKVRKLGTVYIEKSSHASKAHNEIWIDIFPYDNYPDDTKKRKRLIKRITLYRRILFVKSRIKPWLIKQKLFEKTICYIGYLPYRFFSCLISRKKLLFKAKSFQTQYNSQNTSYKYPQGSEPCGQWIVPVDAFNSFEMKTFEDTNFSVPLGYDVFLKNGYGDYMQLPPEDKRENRHNIIEVKL